MVPEKRNNFLEVMVAEALVEMAAEAQVVVVIQGAQVERRVGQIERQVVIKDDRVRGGLAVREARVAQEALVLQVALEALVAQEVLVAQAAAETDRRTTRTMEKIEASWGAA